MTELRIVWLVQKEVILLGNFDFIGANSLSLLCVSPGVSP